MYTLNLFAEGGKPVSSLLDRPEFIYATAGLAGALLLGAAVVYLVDRWRRRAALEDQAAGAEQLSGFRAMFERGEITEAEYARLREKIAARVKPPAEPAAGPGPAAGAGNAPPPGAPPGPAVAGPFPPGYFDEPDLRDPPGGKPPSGGSPPPA